MGCADHRLSSVCHPYRPGGYVLYGNVGKGKKRGASESDALFLINSYTMYSYQVLHHEVIAPRVALRAKEDGTTFEQTVDWERVEE